jgi:hypothetical protein
VLFCLPRRQNSCHLAIKIRTKELVTTSVRSVFPCFPYKISAHIISRLGGVMVSVLATGHKGRGFKPSRRDGFLKAVKIRSTPSFGWEVKPKVRCRRKFSLLRPFRLLAPNVSGGRTAREIWWTSEELSSAGIIINITMALHAHISPGGWTVGGRSSET